MLVISGFAHHEIGTNPGSLPSQRQYKSSGSGSIASFPAQIVQYSFRGALHEVHIIANFGECNNQPNSIFLEVALLGGQLKIPYHLVKTWDIGLDPLSCAVVADFWYLHCTKTLIHKIDSSS